MNVWTRSAAAIALALFAAGAASAAGVRTHVTLVGADPNQPELGLPSLGIFVEGPEADRVALLRGYLERDLPNLVVMRTPSEAEIPDYEIRVTLGPRTASGETERQLFAVALVDHAGRSVWRTDGWTEADGQALEPSTLQGTGRNIVSALVHDGWLQARFNPDDPPPAPPGLRRTDPQN